MRVLNRSAYLLLLVATMAAAQTRHPSTSTLQSGAHMHSGAAVECPWLTRGTASAVLGGDVSLAMSMQGDSDGSCMFRAKQKPSEALTITVSSMPHEVCRKNSVKLTGIANWASLCSVSRSHHRHIESVIGQARNTYFTVTLSFQQKKNWRERDVDIEHIAGLVAGNLY